MRGSLNIHFSLTLLMLAQAKQIYPPWIVIPGSNGTLQLALLDGPSSLVGFQSDQVKYFLYNREHPNIPKQILIGNLQDFEQSKFTYFIVHGFMQSGFEQYIKDMAIKFLSKYDSNVIAVDWQQPADGPYYNQAQKNAKFTGETLGHFIKHLAHRIGATTSSMHCIGFSLGAHACGFAGKVVRTQPLGRITGLDPALPLYHSDSAEERLDINDAIFVDVIHTSSEFLSFLQPLGHADFYPNGGEYQFGCFDFTGSCSHSRSYIYYVESINNVNFKSTKCSSWFEFLSGLCKNNEIVPMGAECPTRASGTYYLQTSYRSPFALG